MLFPAQFVAMSKGNVDGLKFSVVNSYFKMSSAKLNSFRSLTVPKQKQSRAGEKSRALLGLETETETRLSTISLRHPRLQSWVSPLPCSEVKGSTSISVSQVCALVEEGLDFQREKREEEHLRTFGHHSPVLLCFQLHSFLFRTKKKVGKNPPGLLNSFSCFSKVTSCVISHCIFEMV